MLINQLIKLTGNKLSLESAVVFLCTGNEQSENELKKISFTRISRRRKYLGINLTEKVEDLYTESYKTLLKEIKGVLNKQKDILCFWIGKQYY